MNGIRREILIDVLHNRGTTSKQVKYRMTNHPAPVIHTHIGTLIKAGHLRIRSDAFLDITAEGMKTLLPGGNVR